MVAKGPESYRVRRARRLEPLLVGCALTFAGSSAIRASELAERAMESAAHFILWRNSAPYRRIVEIMRGKLHGESPLSSVSCGRVHPPALLRQSGHRGAGRGCAQRRRHANDCNRAER